MKIVNKITINESEETAEGARLLLGVIKTKKNRQQNVCNYSI